MTPDTYMKEVLKTESCDMEPLKRRIQDEKTIRLLHATLGLSTEAGEMLDVLKKHIFYGKPIDEVNLIEEVGDVLWYLSVALDALSSSYSESMTLNIAKLRKRYGEKFSSERAITRNLEAERKILEGKVECTKEFVDARIKPGDIEKFLEKLDK
jgi:NTP pyrophosphatase (non-canonical NTP hydrolase)